MVKLVANGKEKTFVIEVSKNHVDNYHVTPKLAQRMQASIAGYIHSSTCTNALFRCQKKKKKEEKGRKGEGQKESHMYA